FEFLKQAGQLGALGIRKTALSFTEFLQALALLLCPHGKSSRQRTQPAIHNQLHATFPTAIFQSKPALHKKGVWNLGCRVPDTFFVHFVSCPRHLSADSR